MRISWDQFRKLRSKAWSWSGVQTFTSVVISAGTAVLSTAKILGTTGGITLKTSEATGTATAAATFDIEVNVPSGAKIVSTQLRVDTALSSSDGGTAWSAAFIDGSTASVASGAAFAKDTKVSTFFNANAATDITSAETDITVTADSAKTFIAGGKVKAIVTYYEFTAMGAAA